MNLKKKLLAIPACLTLMTSSAHSALVLEFNEIVSGDDTKVIMSFSGFVDISSSQGGLDTNWTVSAQSTLSEQGLVPSINTTNNQYRTETSIGVDALSTTLTGRFTHIDGDRFLGLDIEGDRIRVFSFGFPDTTLTQGRDVTVLDARPGGNLDGVTFELDTSFADSGLSRHAANAKIDLWLANSNANDDAKVQFRVNIPVITPELPSVTVAPLNSTQVKVSVPTIIGQRYEIESSDDLESWTSEESRDGDGILWEPVFDFDTVKFYRVGVSFLP